MTDDVKTHVSLKDKHELGRGEIMATIGDVRFSRVCTYVRATALEQETQSHGANARQLKNSRLSEIVICLRVTHPRQASQLLYVKSKAGA